MEKIKILSIYPYTHISSAALLVDGKIVSAAAEERFNRNKSSTAFPIKTLDWIFRSNKLSWKDIDRIVIPWNPQINLNNVSTRWISEMRWRGELLTNIPSYLMRLQQKNDFKENISINLNDKSIKFLDHHASHVASSYFMSGFDNSDVISIDGHGEIDSCFLGYAKGSEIKKNLSIKYPHSVGLFYGTFTDFLGFKPDSEEWKVMALASFSQKRNVFDKKIEKLVNLNPNGFELDLTFFNYYLFDRQKNFFSDKLCDLLGKPRNKNEKISKKHYEIAGAMQRMFENIVFHLCKILRKKNKQKSQNLCISGGAAMNCVFNGLISRSKIYKNIFIPPCPDDLGVSVGACYLEYFSNIKKSKIYKPKIVNTNYWGPSFKDFEVEKILKNNKISFKKLSEKQLSDFVASKIFNGALVGWFQGSMEFGHRALGNRSILGNPQNKNIKNIVNKAIKFREGFRPFAPICTLSDAHKYFEIEKNYQINFMEKTVIVKKKFRKIFSGITHVDNSARLQTVSEHQNNKIFTLLKSFEKISGHPVLLNT